MLPEKSRKTPTIGPQSIRNRQVTVGREISEEEENEDLESEQPGSAEFAYESDLKNYLAKNMSIIESGF